MSTMDYSVLAVYFSKYYSQLIRYCMRYVGSMEDSEDIVQDCFVKLWEKKYILNDASAGAFLFTMARNACFNVLKHRAVVSDFAAYCFKQNEQSADASDYEYLSAVNDGGVITDPYIFIRKEVDKLPDRCKEVFSMSRYDGLSNKEIADKLGISEPAVHKHIDNAISKLKKKFR